MHSTGSANLPLHGGHCPPWLFARMVKLGTCITETIVMEFGALEMLRRLSDPVWFQALGSVLGFDWHSSGLTTTLCGALKEGMKDRQGELGLFFAGGKGKTSRQTPFEIEGAIERYSLNLNHEVLQSTSRLVAKVDNTALQDGYQLYHHFFVFTAAGQWTVVQQGMNENSRYARRYHWLGEDVRNFVNEPHKGISGVKEEKYVLDLTASDSNKSRDVITELACRQPEKNHRELNQLIESSTKREGHSFFLDSGHAIPNTARLDKALREAYNYQPADFKELLEVSGVGPATIRALAMVAEIIYGVPASHRDPVRYCFAHGGKDGYPFPVNKGDYDNSIEVLKEVINRAKIGYYDKMEALCRLGTWQEQLNIIATPFVPEKKRIDKKPKQLSLFSEL